MQDLERVYEFAFKALNPFPGYLKPEPHIVDGAFRLGETEITPLPVPHGHTIVNGYLFSRHGQKLVAYLSDCSEVPPAISSQIAGVKALIIDALRHKPHPTHLSVDQALEVAGRVRPEQTYFTHVCHELPQPAGTHIAYDGLQLKF
jgi:phosphoribosyl 1,2-cyclic phosphate phosphodiesterase